MGKVPKVNRKSISVRLTCDHGGSEKRGGSGEGPPQLAKELFRLYEAQLAQALSYDIPGALLLALAMLEQL